MTEAEVQKLRDRGVSDAVILDMQKEEAESSGQAAPAVTASSPLPEIDPNTPSRVYSQAQSTETPTQGQGQTWTQTAIELAPAIGSGVVAAAPYAAGAAGLYGGGKLLSAARTAADAYKTGVQTAADTAQRNIALQEARMAERMARPGPVAPPTATMAPPTATMAPPTAVAPPAAAPTMAPPAAAPAAAQPGMLSRMMSAAAPYVRTAARMAGPAAVLYEGLQPRNLNTGEQQQLAQMRSPESVAETQRNRQAIAAAGRQPTSQADLDNMIRAAAAKRALIGQ